MARRSAHLESGPRARTGASRAVGLVAAGAGPQVASEQIAGEQIAGEIFESLCGELVRRADELGVATPERHREAVRGRFRDAGLLN